MAGEKQPSRVRGIFPIIGMVVHMCFAIAVAPFMGVLGVASRINRWGAEQFGKTL